jgi:hypothetical protein
LHHPQLHRFRAQPAPLAAIADYLARIHAEATGRGFTFAAAKIGAARRPVLITVTRGQLMYEWEHLMKKLERRDGVLRAQLARISRPRPHPSFRIVAGEVEAWEKQ